LPVLPIDSKRTGRKAPSGPGTRRSKEGKQHG
jgi:hypothetical protein